MVQNTKYFAEYILHILKSNLLLKGRSTYLVMSIRSRFFLTASPTRLELFNFTQLVLSKDMAKSLYSKTFNPNLQKKVILHELYTYYISYKGIELIFLYIKFM